MRPKEEILEWGGTPWVQWVWEDGGKIATKALKEIGEIDDK